MNINRISRVTISINIVLLLIMNFGFSSAQTIDRSKNPRPGQEPKIKIKKPKTFTLANGIRVIIVENHKLPKVSASLFINRAPVYEGGKKGEMVLMGAMLGQGTGNMTKAQFDDNLEYLGANINFSSSSVNLSSLSQYFEEAFMLMAEALINPSFPEEAFDKIKSQAITSVISSKNNVKAISASVSNALVYGKDHPFGEFETEETLNKITLQDVKSCYKKYFIPNRAYLVLVGDIKYSRVKKTVKKAFKNWQPVEYSEPVYKMPENISETEIDLIDAPYAVQSEIVVTNAIQNTKSNKDYFKLIIANQLLGGRSTGYLFKTLREQYGYTYGAYSSVNANKYGSRFSAYASVRTEVTDSAVYRMMEQIKRINSQKPEESKLHLVKQQYKGAWGLNLESPGTIASFAVSIEIDSLRGDFYNSFLKNIDKVTLDDALYAAKKYFLAQNARIIVVGNAKKIKPGLKALGYKINCFDNYANHIICP